VSKTVKWTMRGVIIAVGIALVIWIASLLPGSLNPFKTRDVDRSQPAVLQSIQDIGQFRAASANLQLVVDLEKDTRFVPDFIKGERTLFVASGAVDAGVDLSSLGNDGIVVDADRKSVTITLPAAQLYPAQVDLDKSYVIDKQRGVLNRVGGLFTDGPEEKDVYTLAQRKLQEGAAADARLLEKARTNTRQMLESLLGSLGFTSVNVTFAEAPGT
jgi:Protein of unknown function (DUF4230)